MGLWFGDEEGKQKNTSWKWVEHVGTVAEISRGELRSIFVQGQYVATFILSRQSYATAVLQFILLHLLVLALVQFWPVSLITIPDDN